ncbi:unnamed protein product [Rotaria sordida]|uniref:Uncharacterized protein n=1 Tax=Rotaria sordida TaxID=392033 RepID=A0A814EK28_9BILA|nr:unnamed protein product [Rotaria sordida]CAF4155374.1 unnamed protein product [Rotaria sordida]
MYIGIDNDKQNIDFIKHRENIESVLHDLPTNQWITKQLHEVVHLIPLLSLDAIRNYALGESALKLALPYLQRASTISIKTHKSKEFSNIIKIEAIAWYLGKCARNTQSYALVQIKLVDNRSISMSLDLTKEYCLNITNCSNLAV